MLLYFAYINNPFYVENKNRLINNPNIAKTTDDLSIKPNDKTIKNNSSYDIVPRKRLIARDKVYINMYHEKYKRSHRALIYIGIDLINLLKFNPYEPVNITYHNNQKNTLELSQKNDVGYSLTTSSNLNYSTLHIKIPDVIPFIAKGTRELDFDFTNDNSLLINLEKYYD